MFTGWPSSTPVNFHVPTSSSDVAPNVDGGLGGEGAGSRAPAVGGVGCGDAVDGVAGAGAVATIGGASGAKEKFPRREDYSHGVCCIPVSSCTRARTALNMSSIGRWGWGISCNRLAVKGEFRPAPSPAVLPGLVA